MIRLLALVLCATVANTARVAVRNGLMEPATTYCSQSSIYLVGPYNYVSRDVFVFPPPKCMDMGWQTADGRPYTFKTAPNYLKLTGASKSVECDLKGVCELRNDRSYGSADANMYLFLVDSVTTAGFKLCMARLDKLGGWDSEAALSVTATSIDLCPAPTPPPSAKCVAGFVQKNTECVWDTCLAPSAQHRLYSIGGNPGRGTKCVTLHWTNTLGREFTWNALPTSFVLMGASQVKICSSLPCTIEDGGREWLSFGENFKIELTSATTSKFVVCATRLDKPGADWAMDLKLKIAATGLSSCPDCKPGYARKGTNPGCVFDPCVGYNVSACGPAPNSCSPLPEDSPAPQFKCSCTAGYLNPGPPNNIDTRQCVEDICSKKIPCASPHTCQTLFDTSRNPSQFQCKCATGFINARSLSSGESDNTLCVKDMCSTNPCPENSVCQPYTNTFRCICNEGFKMVDGKCVEIDACQFNNGGCDVNAICTSSRGQATCKCKVGYADQFNNGKLCSRITCKDNPCQINIFSFKIIQCEDLVTQTAPFYRCSCFPGYQDTSPVPSNVPKCQAVPYPDMDPNATCQIVGTTAKQCTCKSGYTMKVNAQGYLVCLK
eukprot:TRINITY_DN121_c0_g1_i3.p1 TRINITY_DN121_c0_g1~~TRINITY_DN121_c0_g1_i3.p1  ORF type:complete len:605 (+),score=86.49 TRINITY_DN121_c0_g1_i3:102-1916(+)